MDVITATLIGLLLIILTGGVWGSILLSSLMRRREAKLGSPADFALLGELQEDRQLLEARLGQLEEEISFIRELRGPERLGQLTSPEAEDPQQ